MKKYKCPCCGYYTFENKPNGLYDICPVCFWEDDLFAYEDQDRVSDCNHVSLNKAKQNYKEFGACCEKDIDFVRKPNDDELSGIE